MLSKGTFECLGFPHIHGPTRRGAPVTVNGTAAQPLHVGRRRDPEANVRVFYKWGAGAVARITRRGRDSARQRSSFIDVEHDANFKLE